MGSMSPSHFLETKIVFLGVHETELYSKVPEIVDTPKNNMAFEYIEDHGNGTVERAQN